MLGIVIASLPGPKRHRRRKGLVSAASHTPLIAVEYSHFLIDTHPTTRDVIRTSGKKFSIKIKCQYGWPEKVQKQGWDENTRRLSRCRKVMVKKGWKTILLLLQKLSQPTEVE